MSPDDCIFDLLGKRYEKGGRGPLAFDCYGLVEEIGRRLGIPYPPIQTPEALADTHAAYLLNRECCRPLAAPATHCVVAFSMVAPFVTHMGVVLSDCRRFIHILRKRMVTVERLDDPIWSRKIAGYYEHSSRPNR